MRVPRPALPLLNADQNSQTFSPKNSPRRPRSTSPPSLSAPGLRSSLSTCTDSPTLSDLMSIPAPSGDSIRSSRASRASMAGWAGSERSSDPLSDGKSSRSVSDQGSRNAADDYEQKNLEAAVMPERTKHALLSDVDFLDEVRSSPPLPGRALTPHALQSASTLVNELESLTSLVDLFSASSVDDGPQSASAQIVALHLTGMTVRHLSHLLSPPR